MPALGFIKRNYIVSRQYSNSDIDNLDDNDDYGPVGITNSTKIVVIIVVCILVFLALMGFCCIVTRRRGRVERDKRERAQREQRQTFLAERRPGAVRSTDFRFSTEMDAGPYQAAHVRANSETPSQPPPIYSPAVNGQDAPKPSQHEYAPAPQYTSEDEYGTEHTSRREGPPPQTSPPRRHGLFGRVGGDATGSGSAGASAGAMGGGGFMGGVM
ncbi:MAG: hypothetical protein M4579_002238 [Chaenotheca gracillima]|nr:MAG: hypothetical protein M4579_002238 [Chaenotheca gracillima]